MGNHLFGGFLIFYGALKILIIVLNFFSPDNIRNYLIKIPVLGHIFEDNDYEFAHNIFNLCFLIYGVHTLLHGLNITNHLHVPHWILSHDANYALHLFLGMFMSIFYYSLLDVNQSFYVVEGVYVGLAFLATVPIVYLLRDIKRTLFEKIVSYMSLFVLTYMGIIIAQHYPNRVPNVMDMIAIPLSSL